ncbi:MAG: short-chain dehydrogenase [halophilic archaeon J07HB67]|jgi:Short-chain dehydrogenases of various substrate specificities|nr:MAG: short-chain dehydrogenase [halophilic archaeon J07HB67]
MERTVVITGCSSGIGRATVEAFREEGWTVYATARDTDDLAAFEGRDGCRVAELDVTVEGDVDRVIERVIDETERIDCLVNNAGYGQLGPVEDVPTARVVRQYDVNLYGPLRLIRAALPEMRRRGEGTVVNVTSVTARVPFPGGGVYAGSKAALSATTESLRAEVDTEGIDVVEVEPGPVETGFDDRVATETTDLDRTAAYDGVYGLFEDANAVGGGGPLAVSPEAVAAEIREAAVSTDPGARVPVGPVARVATFAGVVPQWARTRLWRLLGRLVG